MGPGRRWDARSLQANGPISLRAAATARCRPTPDRPPPPGGRPPPPPRPGWRGCGWAPPRWPPPPPPWPPDRARPASRRCWPAVVTAHPDALAQAQLGGGHGGGDGLGQLSPPIPPRLGDGRCTDARGSAEGVAPGDGVAAGDGHTEARAHLLHGSGCSWGALLRSDPGPAGGGGRGDGNVREGPLPPSGEGRDPHGHPQTARGRQGLRFPVGGGGRPGSGLRGLPGRAPGLYLPGTRGGRLPRRAGGDQPLQDRARRQGPREATPAPRSPPARSQGAPDSGSEDEQVPRRRPREPGEGAETASSAWPRDARAANPPSSTGPGAAGTGERAGPAEPTGLLLPGLCRQLGAAPDPDNPDRISS